MLTKTVRPVLTSFAASDIGSVQLWKLGPNSGSPSVVMTRSIDHEPQLNMEVLREGKVGPWSVHMVGDWPGPALLPSAALVISLVRLFGTEGDQMDDTCCNGHNGYG